MNKKRSILLVTILFIIFSLTFILNSSSYDVINVISPFEVVIDKNKNGEVDDGETIKLLQGYQILTKDKNSNKLASELNLDDYTQYSFAYLTQKYENYVLLYKKVTIKKINGNNEIFISGEKYCDILAKSGYLFKDGNPTNIEAYKKRLHQIKNADYRLYNAKSNKYHLLTCEYGRKSHIYVLLAKNQLPKGASPCKFCLGNLSKIKEIKNSNHKTNIKPPQSIYSSGAIKIFLTDHTRNLIPNRLGNTAICNELVKQINNAKSTIDIAIYGYDRVPKIENAIKKAINRGVKVRLVCDIDSKGSNIYEHTNEFSKLIKNTSCDKAPNKIQKPIQYTNAIMHNKFYIFDNSIVITGSANLSYTDMSAFNSNSVILINSKKIAQIYTEEFNQMYEGKFHFLKHKILNKTNIPLGQTLLSISYSPKDETIKTSIIPLINKAQKYIYMPVFLITDKNITDALIKAKSRGVEIKIIVDATNAKNNYSKHKLLRQSGIAVKTENYAGKLHSKSIIIDDKYTIIGSMNFSKSGEHKNDENTLIIVDRGVAKFYKRFFLYQWNRISNFWLTHDVSAESVYSIGSCSDGIDNDYDGKTDLQDDGCKIKLKKRIHH